LEGRVSAAKKWAASPEKFEVPEEEIQYVYAWSLQGRRIPFNPRKNEGSFATGIKQPHFITHWSRSMQVLSVSSVFSNDGKPMTPFVQGENPAFAAFLSVMYGLAPDHHWCWTDSKKVVVGFKDGVVTMDGVQLSDLQADRIFDLTQAFSFPESGVVDRPDHGVSVISGLPVVNSRNPQRFTRLLDGRVRRHAQLCSAIPELALKEFSSCTCDQVSCVCPEIVMANVGGSTVLKMVDGFMADKIMAVRNWISGFDDVPALLPVYRDDSRLNKLSSKVNKLPQSLNVGVSNGINVGVRSSFLAAPIDMVVSEATPEEAAIALRRREEVYRRREAQEKAGVCWWEVPKEVKAKPSPPPPKPVPVSTSALPSDDVIEGEDFTPMKTIRDERVRQQGKDEKGKGSPIVSVNGDRTKLEIAMLSCLGGRLPLDEWRRRVRDKIKPLECSKQVFNQSVSNLVSRRLVNREMEGNYPYFFPAFDGSVQKKVVSAPRASASKSDDMEFERIADVLLGWDDMSLEDILGLLVYHEVYPDKTEEEMVELIKGFMLYAQRNKNLSWSAQRRTVSHPLPLEIKFSMLYVIYPWGNRAGKKPMRLAWGHRYMFVGFSIEDRLVWDSLMEAEGSYLANGERGDECVIELSFVPNNEQLDWTKFIALHGAALSVESDGPAHSLNWTAVATAKKKGETFVSLGKSKKKVNAERMAMRAMIVSFG
jgi:hypothetical protein